MAARSSSPIQIETEPILKFTMIDGTELQAFAAALYSDGVGYIPGVLLKTGSRAEYYWGSYKGHTSFVDALKDARRITIRILH